METPRSLRQADDGHLVTLIGLGRAVAVYVLVRRYEDVLIIPVARGVLGNWADAEEVRSELVVRLLALSMKRDQEHLAGWPPVDVSGWLAAAARRLAVDLKRSRDAEWERRGHQSTWFTKDPTPHDEAEVNERARRLEDGMHDLPKEEREAVQLICRDVPVDVACKAVGVSRATLYRRRDGALARLQQNQRLRQQHEDFSGSGGHSRSR